MFDPNDHAHRSIDVLLLSPARPQQGVWTDTDLARIFGSLIINDLLETDPADQAPIRLVTSWATKAAHYARQAQEAQARADVHAANVRDGLAVVASGFGGKA